MGPVGPPAHLGRPVDLDVLDDEVVGVQPLVLRVALRVLQHVQKELSGLVGPPAGKKNGSGIRKQTFKIPRAE